jgi:hypothetical protein
VALGSLFRLQPVIENALKGLDVSAHKKPAIGKADRNPAIVAALDNLAYLTLQCRLGFPCESLRDQSDSIANFEISSRHRFLVHFPFAFAAALKVLIRYIMSPQNVPLQSIGDRREWDYGKPGRWLGFPNVDVLLFDSYSATQKRKPPPASLCCSRQPMRLSFFRLQPRLYKAGG